MKNKLFTLSAALVLAAVIGTVYSAPALAAVIKAVLVMNVDERGRVPYVAEINCLNLAGVCFGQAAQIPAGKRFVVEFINGDIANMNSPLNIYQVSNNFPGATISYRFLPQPLNNGRYIISEPFHAYFSAGDKPTLDIADIPFSGSVSGSVRLVGYLVDLTI